MLTTAAIVLVVSGGFRTTVGGFRISARSPLPIAILALTSGLAWFVAARRHRAIAGDLEQIWSGIERQASRIILVVAITSGVVAALFATRSAAGADASGYVSEAAMLVRGELFHADDLFDITVGHDAYLTSPLGWRPASSGPRQSPTYPPGLPMLMALPHAIAGVNGAAAVVVVSAVVAVMATGAIAVHIGGATAGIIAACLLAFTPIFIHQSIQPMSDVPVTAAWMLCFLCAMEQRSLFAGVACALAVLIRPNLAPLAIVPLFIVEQRVVFAIPVGVAGATLAGLQWIWYGSALRSGYGSTEELFALANVSTNLRHYATWFISAAPAFVLALYGVIRVHRNRAARSLIAFALLVIAAYLVYAVFEDWSYLRFLLPAMAAFAVFAATELAWWITRLPIAARAAALMIVVVGVTAHALWVARTRDTFKLSDQLHRVSQVAAFINESVPRQAVLISGEQSGSMRYYTNRSIVRWEAATEASMTAALATLSQSERPTYVVLDAWEDDPFRRKTGSAVVLDWPPMLEAGTSHRTRVWRLADRDRFHGGERIETLRLP